MYRTLGDQRSWNAETGATGELGNFKWDVYYNHGNSELTVTNPNNTDNAKYLASLDAVLDGGTIKCYVTTVTAYAALYPGCVPTNLVDPAGPSAAAYDYLRTETSWTLTQELDDVGLTFAAFQFDDARSALLHEPHGVRQRQITRRVTHEGQIGHQKGPVQAARNRGAVINHLIHGHRHRGVVSLNDHAQ